MIAALNKRLSSMQLIALGFIVLILIGTLLLMLPFSSRSGTVTPFLTCLFTATSASCVTGLVLVDTFTHWNLFGQLVLLTLIQIGGLGFITFGVTVAMLTHQKIGLRARGLIRESVNALDIGGMVKLTRRIVKGTILFEGTGAVILALRFIPEMGIIRGIYYGIFHSISAFCNGGFDLMGRYERFSSLTHYYDDWIVNLTIISLILIGGLGFLVWSDLRENKWHFKKYSLHTKLVLIASATLVFGGTLGFYLIEQNRLFAGMPVPTKILCSLFCSVTPRTAGFNTIDSGALTDAGKLLTIILMFIGGCPGSTAGGVKVMSIMVLILHLFSTLFRTNGCNCFGRRLEESAIPKAAAILCMNLFIGLLATLILCGMQAFNGIDTMFEVFSAISTVGMSAGLTGKLNTTAKCIIIFLMYIGRLGSLSFALSLTSKKKTSHLQQPVERISIG